MRTQAEAMESYLARVEGNPSAHLKHDTAGPHMTEKDLQANVTALAKRCGWRVYHTYDSRRSEKGFPDLVMVRDRRLLFAELKSEKGVITDDQHHWLLDIRAVAENCRGLDSTVPIAAVVWRPADWHNGTIEEVLR